MVTGLQFFQSLYSFLSGNVADEFPLQLALMLLA